jgi:thioredoxin reductase
MLDVAIVGGGPAGLAAALILGRARRITVVFDAGPRRNEAAERVHGMVTRDGTPPAELRRLAHEELRAYPTVSFRDARITAIEPAGRGFRIAGEMFRRVLLCTGIEDCVPDLYRALWGTLVLQCPYCHAYEVADRPYAFLATREADLDHALLLRAWTKQVTVIAQCKLSATASERFAKARIAVEPRPLRAVEADGDRVRLRFDGGELVADRLFAHPPQCQTRLVTDMKLALDAHGSVKVDEHYETSVPGVHAAGDLMTHVHSAQVAAGAGAAAAYAVNVAVTLERVVEGSL